MTPSFRSWLEQQIGRAGPRGRLARAVSADADAPDGASKEQWLDHLARCSAGPGAMAAFEEAWQEFSQPTKDENGPQKIMLTIRPPAAA
jgi:hypothetical protein